HSIGAPLALPHPPSLHDALPISLEFVTTATETEALLLEANLIKRLRPRFNVLLRDDKSFPYILITGDHWAPQILKHRGARTRQRSEEHTSELQSRENLVCRLLLE